MHGLHHLQFCPQLFHALHNRSKQILTQICAFVFAYAKACFLMTRLIFNSSSFWFGLMLNIPKEKAIIGQAYA